jgi:predicted metal-dependent HD superfamily phosphohydrolase
MSEVFEKTPQETIIAERIKGQWNGLIESVGGNTSLIDSEFSKMVQEYQSGDGRSYHNLEHIGKVDEILNKYRHLAHNFVSLKLAGDGHDVIYVPGSATNEEDSAVYMKESMKRLGIPESVISETERIILITKHHKTTEDDIDGQLMIDADFAVFASSLSEYDAYAQGIWQEYVGSGKVTEEAFRKGRGDLIDGLLKQDRIFLVGQIRDEFETLARQNLEREKLRLAA